MLQKLIAKILLAPFSALYGLTVSIRNACYDSGLIRSTHFNLPVISVGNLTIGGAGKSPHIEYLISLLKDYINVSTLSRGYKRKSKGFQIVASNHLVRHSGDEPLQFKRKFPEIVVAVAESRNIGIPQLLSAKPQINTILLDDAFQHRSVLPGLNILLSEYENPFYQDYLLPMGRLREWRGAYKRADVIIVSKCPNEIDDKKRDSIIENINPLPHQSVFFSRYKYYEPYSIFDKNQTIGFDTNQTIILLSAIASTSYLKNFVESKYDNVIQMQYEDHHYYTQQDLEQIKNTYEQIDSNSKVILTTEKDGIRLIEHRAYLQKWSLPVYILPITVEFLDNRGPIFDHLIKQYLLNFKY